MSLRGSTQLIQLLVAVAVALILAALTWLMLVPVQPTTQPSVGGVSGNATGVVVLAESRTVQLGPVTVTLNSVSVSGFRVDAVLEVRVPNVCYKVFTSTRSSGGNVTVRVVVVEPPPGTLCIQVLPPPVRLDVNLTVPPVVGGKARLVVNLTRVNPYVDGVESASASLLVAVATKLASPPVAAILEAPVKYNGTLLRGLLVYAWWSKPLYPTRGPPVEAPPVTRSDWIVADPTGWIYVAGAPPPIEPGTLLNVTAVVRVTRIRGVYVPYLKLVSSAPTQ